MILIPSTKTRNGLIYTYGFKGRTFASSTNLHYTRKENPILPNSKDRWCSEATGQCSVETWEVHLDHYIYITNKKDDTEVPSLLVDPFRFNPNFFTRKNIFIFYIHQLYDC